MSEPRQVEVKKYGITRVLLDLRHAELDIGAATKELYEMLQRDGQTQCHRLRVDVVAYIEVDALPTEIQAGIIPEEVQVVIHQRTGRVPWLPADAVGSDVSENR